MKQRLLSLLLLAALLLSLAAPASAAGSMPFTDVTPGDWYYDYVDELYAAEVIHGTTPTLFSPLEDVTLGMALKLILLAAGYPQQPAVDGHWAKGYYVLAQEKNFLPAGLGLTVDEAVNRLQIADIIVRVLGLERLETTPSPFADTDDLNVLILYDYGLFGGSEEGGQLLFRPQSYINRAEITAVLSRLYALVNDPPAPEDPDNPPDIPPEDPDDPDSPDDPGTEFPPSVDPDDPAQPPETTGEYFYFSGKKVPYLAGVARKTYDNALFQYNDNGLLTYESDQYTSKIGIDVSKYQGDIDWAQVKEAGVDFAILRLGYRGYGSAGNIAIDTTFHQNIQGALDNGIEVGVYFFSQAINQQEAREEAQICMSHLAGYDITYPIVYDWEPYPASVPARTHGLSDTMLTNCTIAFCEEVKENGYDPMVYSNLTYFYLHLNLARLTDYPLWLAQYNRTPTFQYHFQIWQYSCTGKVPGITGDVDLNIHLVPKA